MPPTILHFNLPRLFPSSTISSSLHFVFLLLPYQQYTRSFLPHLSSFLPFQHLLPLLLLPLQECSFVFRLTSARKERLQLVPEGEGVTYRGSRQLLEYNIVSVIALPANHSRYSALQVTSLNITSITARDTNNNNNKQNS